MSEKDVKDRWDRHWSMGASLEDNASPIGRRLRKRRLEIMREMLAPLDKGMTVVDAGSGNGSTLRVLRECGFAKSVGYEYTDGGLAAAERLNGFKVGVDIFKGDAKALPYPDRGVDMYYSEGLWEHFKDPTPFMDEAVRVADKYIMVIQPNHFSPAGFALKLGWDLLESEKGGVKEYSFRLEYFEKYLKDRGFDLVQKRSTQFNEQSVMLFKRR